MSRITRAGCIRSALPIYRNSVPAIRSIFTKKRSTLDPGFRCRRSCHWRSILDGYPLDHTNPSQYLSRTVGATGRASLLVETRRAPIWNVSGPFGVPFRGPVELSWAIFGTSGRSSASGGRRSHRKPLGAIGIQAATERSAAAARTGRRRSGEAIGIHRGSQESKRPPKKCGPQWGREKPSEATGMHREP